MECRRAPALRKRPPSARSSGASPCHWNERAAASRARWSHPSPSEMEPHTCRRWSRRRRRRRRRFQCRSTEQPLEVRAAEPAPAIRTRRHQSLVLVASRHSTVWPSERFSQRATRSRRDANFPTRAGRAGVASHSIASALFVPPSVLWEASLTRRPTPSPCEVWTWNKNSKWARAQKVEKTVLGPGNAVRSPPTSHFHRIDSNICIFHGIAAARPKKWSALRTRFSPNSVPRSNDHLSSRQTHTTFYNSWP